MSLHRLGLRHNYIRIVVATRPVRTFTGRVHDLGLHVLWCPKYRRAVLGGEDVGRLRELIGQKAAEHGRGIIALEVMPGRVRLFVRHDPEASASYVANQFEGHTSHALRSGFPHLRSRLPTLWSRACFASAGVVSAETVRRYTGTQ